MAELSGPDRAPRGAHRRRRARSGRGRERARQALRRPRRSGAARSAAGSTAVRRVPPTIRPAGLGPSPPRLALRVRLRVGALPPAAEAPLGLVRTADRLRGPLRRPDRAPDRPGSRPRARPRSLVGGRLRSAPRGRLCRRDARSASRVPAVRTRGDTRLGTPPSQREKAVPDLGGEMQYVNLGHTGLRVSRVCLGMMSFGKHESREWALDEAEAEPIVRRAVEGGIIFFDTADVYNGGQSEVVTGRLLRKLFGMREEYVVATKVHGRTMPGENGRGLSRKHILASIDASLERLGLDYVDLYQTHRWDPTTPVAETMEALHDVVESGKARYIGASSMYAWQFAKAQHVAPTPFVSMQNHYNLVYREEEREMIPQCIDQGVGVLPWSPLARGLLAGTRTREGEGRTTRARTDPFGDSLYA